MNGHWLRSCGLLVVLSLTACAAEARPAPADRADVAVVEAVLAPPVEAVTEEVPVAVDCGRAITAASLAATWPQHVGERVRLGLSIERALDMTTALAHSGHTRFVVVLGPDQLWTGRELHIFTVMGSTRVRIGGQVQLPQLLLEDVEGCDLR